MNLQEFAKKVANGEEPRIKDIIFEEGQLGIVGIKSAEQLNAEGLKKKDGTPYKEGTTFMMLASDRAGAVASDNWFYEGTTAKAVCFKNISTAKAEKLGLKIGDDLNQIMPKPGAIQITEISQSQYDEMVANDPNSVLGFKAKINPSTGQEVLSSNEVVYAKSEFAWADECTHTLLPTDKVGATVQA